MAKYKVVAVIWGDHVRSDRQEIPKNPDDLIVNTLTIGVLVKKTPNTLLVVSEIEPYHDRVDATYTTIIRKTVRAIEEYGYIDLDL